VSVVEEVVVEVVVVVWRVSCRRNGLGGEVHQNTNIVEGK